MRIPILHTKLKVPQLPPVMVGDRRLQDLGEEILKANITVITAPAGYGKTTLMAAAMQEAKARGHRVCWYRLGEEDRDLTVFYTHLLEAFFPEGGGLEESRGRLEDWGDLQTRYQYLNVEICQELWNLTHKFPAAKTFIAFDDFQQIMDTPEIYMSLQFVLDNLPDSYGVVLGSRYDTGILTGKRRLVKNTREIIRKNLCFSAQETALLLQERGRVKAGEDLVQKIMHHTEGWPAGIILVSQMLSQRGLDEAALVLDRFSREELFFQYMASEVLETIEADLLSFLVKAAILDEFSADQAAVVFDEEKAAELLEKSHKKGLFIQKITGPVTVFHIHSLFRKALLQVQPRHLTAEEVNRYHLKAAAYHLKQKNFEQAIEHFLLCGSVDKAVELITGESLHLIATQAVEPLRQWFRRLPPEVVAHNGHLLFIQSFTTQKGVMEALRLLDEAIALFQEARDPAMQFFAQMAMYHLKVQLNDISGQKKIRDRMAELSLNLPEEPFKSLAMVMDFTYTVWAEKTSRGISLYKQLQTMDLFGEWQWLALLHASHLYYLRDELDLAWSKAREALALEVAGKTPLLKGTTLLSHALILLARDQQASQPWVLQDLMATGEKYGYLFLTGAGKRLGALVCYRRHDLENALALLEESTGDYEKMGNTAMAASNRLLGLLWLSGQENPETLLSRANKPLQALMAAPAGQFLQEIGLSIYGTLSREAGNYQLAEKNLKTAHKRSKNKGTRMVAAGICLHLAKLYFDTGRDDLGEDYLKQAFGEAEENRFIAYFDLHFSTLVEMALRSIRGRIHSQYALAMIAHYYGSEGAEFLRQTAHTADLKIITATFLSRYGNRAEPAKPVIQVKLFGRFEMAVDNLSIPEDEWKTKKTAGLLKYLLVHKNRPASKDRLMEAFWPGTDKKLASMSLRAALYELKKVLAKYGLGPGAETAFLVERRDSLGVRTGKNLMVDVDAFLAGSEELQAAARDAGSRKALLKRMVTLYRGDLLEEELYEDWAFTEREEFRSLFLEAAMDLADLYIAEGDHREAEKLLLKILALDEYNEEACLRLLRLFIAQNQRSRAVKLYAKFTDHFEKELNMKPDERLSALFKN